MFVALLPTTRPKFPLGNAPGYYHFSTKSLIRKHLCSFPLIRIHLLIKTGPRLHETTLEPLFFIKEGNQYETTHSQVVEVINILAQNQIHHVYWLVY